MTTPENGPQDALDEAQAARIAALVASFDERSKMVAEAEAAALSAEQAEEEAAEESAEAAEASSEVEDVPAPESVEAATESAAEEPVEAAEASPGADDSAPASAATDSPAPDSADADADADGLEPASAATDSAAPDSSSAPDLAEAEVPDEPVEAEHDDSQPADPGAADADTAPATELTDAPNATLGASDAPNATLVASPEAEAADLPVAEAEAEADSADDTTAFASRLPDLTEDEALHSALEALLLVVDSPAEVESLAAALDEPVKRIRAALKTMAAQYAEQNRGIDLRDVGGGWRFYTRDKYAPFVEKLLHDGQRAKLTRAALESLAVIAYRQPVTRARVAAVRGVNVDGVIRTLLVRGLIEETGTDKDTGGILYRTTELFLERLGLSSLEDLPPIAPLLPEVDAIDDV